MSALPVGSRILLLGKTGQVGSELLRMLSSQYEVLAPSREEADLAQVSRMQNDIFAKFQPQMVINTAAFHKVEACEVESEMAFRINVVAQRDLARLCRKTNAIYVTFSTDYVFDGLKQTAYVETDRPQPLQIYGISRLAGEQVVQAEAPASYIIRTCGVFGHGNSQAKGLNFIDGRLRDMTAQSSIEVASEQIVSPTYAAHLAKAVTQVLQHPEGRPGIYHLVNEGECSWYQLTATVAKLVQSKCVVKPIDRKGLSGEMRRPLRSALANSKAKTLGIILPHWKDAVREYLEKGNLK